MGLFGGVRALVEWNRLGLRLARVKDALQKESDMDGYDWTVTLRKGLEGILHGAIPVLLLAMFSYLTDAGALSAALQSAHYSPTLVAVVVPVLVGLAKMGQNWWKNRPAAPPTSNVRPFPGAAGA